jgi:ATP-binding protein involved in chromosome partitioning
MFLSEAINVPVLGIIENMAYFTEELPDNKYYISVKKEPKLSRRFRCAFPWRSSNCAIIREAGDYGRPAALQSGSVVANVFEEITRKVVEQTVRRNESLPATEAIKDYNGRMCCGEK